MTSLFKTKDHPLCLLVIDEKAYLTDLYRQGFRNKGILTYFTDQSSEAKRYLKNKKIQAVCINMDFDHGRGLEIFKTLLNTFQNKSVLWVVSSVGFSKEQEDEVLNLGADLVVRMPISKEFLIKKIRLALGGQKRQSERISINGYVILCHKGKAVNTALKELSVQGLLVESSPDLHDLDPTDSIPLKVYPEGLPQPIHTESAFVRTSSCQKHMAFVFKNLDHSNQNLLKEFIHHSQNTFTQIIRHMSSS